MMLERHAAEAFTNVLFNEAFQGKRGEDLPPPPSYHEESSQIDGIKPYKDDYHYLRNRKDKRTEEALKQESHYAQRFFQRPRFSRLQRELFHEMKSMVDPGEISLPLREGNFWYYARYEKNEEYPLQCRRPYDPQRKINTNFLEEVCEWRTAHPKAQSLPSYPDEVIFLDLNLLVRELNLKYVEIGDMDVSFDETKLALTLDCSGGKEIFTLFLFEIQDVNYQRWLNFGASEAQRAWVGSLRESNRSIYTPVQSPRGSRSTPASPSSPNSRRILNKWFMGSRQPRAHGSPEVSPNIRNSAVPPTPTPPRTPPPRHSCLQKIELFDLCGEVLWVNPTCLMYLVLDQKLRPFQVVFHDTTVDPANPDATWICYEEEDEMFCLDCLSFTSDYRYLVFSSASKEISEWFICPTEDASHAAPGDAGGKRSQQRRVVPSIPFFSRKMEHMERRARELSAAYEEAAPAKNGTHRCLFNEKPARTARFSVRTESPVEYDLAHHERFLGPSEGAGAWIITSNARGCTNFGVFFLPDCDVDFSSQVCAPAVQKVPEGGGPPSALNLEARTADATASASRSLSLCASEDVLGIASDSWPLLFAYDPSIKVESVECFRDFILITICRIASSEVLFCPMSLIWDWWSSASSVSCREANYLSGSLLVEPSGSFCLERGGWARRKDLPSPLNLSQTILLSSLVRREFGHLTTTEWLRFDVHEELARRHKGSLTPFATSQSMGDLDYGIPLQEQFGTLCFSADQMPGFGFPSQDFFENFHKAQASENPPGTSDLPEPEKSVDWDRLVKEDITAREARCPQSSTSAAIERSALCATPLLDSVEAYPTHIDFSAPTFTMSLFHLLMPTSHYRWHYLSPSNQGQVPSELFLPEDAEKADAASSEGCGRVVKSQPAKGILCVKMLKREVVHGRAYNSSEYSGCVLWVPSDYAFRHLPSRTDLTPVPTAYPAEWTLVPVFTIWKTDLFRKSANCALLNVYGSYGDSFELEFTPERLTLLDRGFVWAYAAVRGGGEQGIPWRDAGRKLQRATSVNDFISVSRFLVDVGFCAKGFLSSSGSSAGGMVVCRAVNSAPDLYLSVTSSAPFVDCLATLLDATLPLTITEREEFGDPTTSERAFDLIQHISPVATVPSEAIAPNILLVTSLEDTRVGFWEPAKLSAVMRSRMLNGNTVGRFILLACDTNASHSGSSGRYAQLKETAREYAFVIDAVRREEKYLSHNGTRIKTISEASVLGIDLISDDLNQGSEICALVHSLQKRGSPLVFCDFTIQTIFLHCMTYRPPINRLTDILKRNSPQVLERHAEELTKAISSLPPEANQTRFIRNHFLINPRALHVLCDEKVLEQHKVFAVYKPAFCPMRRRDADLNYHKVSVESYIAAALKSQLIYPITQRILGGDQMNIRVLNDLDLFASGPVVVSVSDTCPFSTSLKDCQMNYDVLVAGHISPKDRKREPIDVALLYPDVGSASTQSYCTYEVKRNAYYSVHPVTLLEIKIVAPPSARAPSIDAFVRDHLKTFVIGDPVAFANDKEPGMFTGDRSSSVVGSSRNKRHVERGCSSTTPTTTSHDFLQSAVISMRGDCDFPRVFTHLREIRYSVDLSDDLAGLSSLQDVNFHCWKCFEPVLRDTNHATLKSMRINLLDGSWTPSSEFLY